MSLELNAAQMAAALPMERAIHLMRDAFRLLSSGDAVCPVRINLPIAERNANSLIMPCHLPGGGSFGVKTANVFPENHAPGPPVINSVYHLYSAETGLLMATMDGTFLTKLRTGAASGLATDLLAAEDASVLAIFGTGGQADSQIEGVCAVREIREILVFGRNRAKSEEFAGRIAAVSEASIHAADGPADLRRADVICTATTSTTPLFDAGDVKPGVHINAIGAYRPDMCEVPPALIANGHLIVDQTEAVLEEAGDLIQPLQAGLITRDHIAGELGMLVDQPDGLRRAPNQVSVFKSVGSAVQDLVCARELLDQIPG